MDILQRATVLDPIGPLVATFLLGFTTFLLMLWYSYQKQTYWKKLGVVHVKPVPFLGSVLGNLRKPLHDTELNRYNEYGRIYGHYEGNRPLLSVAEPKILRNIFVKDFQAFTGRRRFDVGDKVLDKMMSILQGEDWKRVRSIVTPTFTTGKIKRMISIFNDCSQTLVKNFRKAAEKGEPIEIKRIYGAFTMDVIASSAFSTKIDSHNDPNNAFVKTARDVFTRNISWRFVLFTLMPSFMKFFRISIFAPAATKFFTNATLQIMEERKRTGKVRNDFLQLLMDTAKEVAQEEKLDTQEQEKDITDNYGKEESDIVFKTITSKKSLSSDELVAQCVIFFLAGYDTTASTLSFISYLLALNPNVQEKLIEEVDKVLNQNNGELTYAAVQNMKYLDNVISETMRLYPPAIRLERVADEDYELEDTGITIPKDMIVTIPVYAMHRDPKLFPDPEKFDPDRWLPEERAKQEQYSYLPFGAGPRNCVGMRFALMEVKVCLAHVLSSFRIKRCSKTKVPLDFYIGQGLLQPKDISVLFEIRKDAQNVL